MAHAIFGERFLSRGKSAWHGLGEVFDIKEQLTMVDAVKRARLNYYVGLLPQQTKKAAAADKLREQDRQELKRLGIDFVEPVGSSDDETRYVVTRFPTADDAVYRNFGEASANFKILQNIDAATVIDNGLGGRYPVETAGALGNGERIFLSLRGNSFAVNDVDEITSYYVVEINHTPGRANRVLYTPVRVVCANTLAMGTARSQVNLTIPHTGNPAELLAFGTEIVEQLANAEGEAKAVFNAMAAVKITPGDLDRILDHVFPAPAVPKKVQLIQDLTDEQMAELLMGPNRHAATSAIEAQKARDGWLVRLEEYKAATRELYEKFNDEHPSMAETVWAAYNATTECSDWRRGGKRVAESVLFGSRADEKRRAFEVCQEVITARFN